MKTPPNFKISMTTEQGEYALLNHNKDIVKSSRHISKKLTTVRGPPNAAKAIKAIIKGSSKKVIQICFSTFNNLNRPKGFQKWH